MSAFHLEAGKYAAYLWPAYGASLLLLGGLVIESLAAARRWRKRAEDASSQTISPESEP